MSSRFDTLKRSSSNPRRMKRTLKYSTIQVKNNVLLIKDSAGILQDFKQMLLVSAEVEGFGEIYSGEGRRSLFVLPFMRPDDDSIGALIGKAARNDGEGSGAIRRLLDIDRPLNSLITEISIRCALKIEDTSEEVWRVLSEGLDLDLSLLNFDFHRPIPSNHVVIFSLAVSSSLLFESYEKWIDHPQHVANIIKSVLKTAKGSGCSPSEGMVTE